MERPITGFERDGEGHWVAQLSCGHGQHVRHEPPFQNRPWAESEAERRSRIGHPLDCVRCDRRELPEQAFRVRRTATFDEETIPKGLLGNHNTRRGTWGLIHVERGELDYLIQEPRPETIRVTPEAPGVIAPEMKHRVRPVGAVRFFVEFWRRPEPEARGD